MARRIPRLQCVQQEGKAPRYSITIPKEIMLQVKISDRDEIVFMITNDYELRMVNLSKHPRFKRDFEEFPELRKLIHSKILTSEEYSEIIDKLHIESENH